MLGKELRKLGRGMQWKIIIMIAPINVHWFAANNKTGAEAVKGLKIKTLHLHFKTVNTFIFLGSTGGF